MIVNENNNGIKPSSEEIDRSVSVLANLAKDTERLVNLPEEQRDWPSESGRENYFFPNRKETLIIYVF